MKIKHLISINDLGQDEIDYVFNATQSFKKGVNNKRLEDKSVATVFFEDSTRTKSSFTLAASKLGMHVLNLEVSQSSITKGESMIDTINTIAAYGTSAVVIRHKESGILKLISNKVNASIISAGEGCFEHPTQSLLDFVTIKEHFGNVKGLKIAIVGDILHSRVARSNIKLLTKLGAHINLVGPTTLVPDYNIPNVKVYHNLTDGIMGANVIYVLRIQKERMDLKFISSFEDYARLYQVSHDTLKNADKDVIIMHPGPKNRGVEITSNLADDGKYSKVLTQVENGLYTRQAIFSLICG